jgi:hypothetical protein
MRAILGQLGTQAELLLGDRFVAQHAKPAIDEQAGHGALGEVLTSLGRREPQAPGAADRRDRRPGGGHPRLHPAPTAGRSHQFPQSVVLCGVRDVRDYRIHASSEKSVVTGGSAFNIKAKSLRIGDFVQSEVEALYGRHTQETGHVEGLQAATRSAAGAPASDGR